MPEEKSSDMYDISFEPYEKIGLLPVSGISLVFSIIIAIGVLMGFMVGCVCLSFGA